MSLVVSSTVECVPSDPVGEAVAAAIAGVMGSSSVELLYAPHDAALPPAPDGPGTASAVGDGPPGWKVRLTVRLAERIAPLAAPATAPLLEILGVLPDAGLQVAARFSALDRRDPAPLSPALHRAVRDGVFTEGVDFLLSDRPAGVTPRVSCYWASGVAIRLVGTGIHRRRTPEGFDVPAPRPGLTRFATGLLPSS